MTTVLDGAGEGSAKACCVLMRGARADMFGCASYREIFQLHQKLPFWQPKNRTGIGAHRSAPRPYGKPHESAIATGYVRRSEFRRRTGGATARANNSVQ